MFQKIPFPTPEEYPEYAEMYMQWVQKDDSLLYQLEASQVQTLALINSLSEPELQYRYAPNKWTVKEVLVHIIDDERIYAYRALSFARNDQTELPGFEQEEYNEHADCEQRDISNIIAEYKAVRAATITLFNGFSRRALARIGNANKNQTSVRALGYHILGHELHHIHILKTKYLALTNP